MSYFCGTSDTNDASDTSNTSDTSDTDHSSDARMTSASVTRLSSYFLLLHNNQNLVHVFQLQHAR